MSGTKTRALLMQCSIKDSHLLILIKHKDALNCYEEILKLMPDDVNTLYWKGMTLKKLNQPEGQKVLETNPENGLF